MPSILFIDQYASIGGGQTALLAMVESCLDHGWTVGVLAPTGGELEAVLKSRFSDRVTVKPLREMKLTPGKKSASDFIRLVSATFDLLKARRWIHQHALLHVNGARYFPALFLASPWIRIPFFLHLHLDHSRAEKLLISQLAKLKLCAGIFVNSKFVMSRLGRLDSAKAILLRYGLSKTFSALPFFKRVQFKKAVVVGRLSPEKGQDLVIEVAKRMPDFSFHFVGAADFHDSKFAVSLTAANLPNVVFEGKAMNVIETLNRIDPRFSIVPSRWAEPFGLVAVESMALSIETVTTGRGGLSEISEATGNRTFTTPLELERLLRSPQNTQAVEKEFERTQSVFGWSSFDFDFQRALNSALGQNHHEN